MIGILIQTRCQCTTKNGESIGKYDGDRLSQITKTVNMLIELGANLLRRIARKIMTDGVTNHFYKPALSKLRQVNKNNNKEFSSARVHDVVEHAHEALQK